MTPSPPLSAVRLLRACMSARVCEIVTGDLEEEFSRGRTRAWFWRQTLRSILAYWAGAIVGGVWALISDMRAAARALVRQRRFALTAVSTLGFALALAVSVLAGVNTYLVRGLPYPESHRLYNVNIFQPGIDMPPQLEALKWESLSDLADTQIAWDLDLFNLRGAPYAEAAQGTWVTPDYLEGFGIRTAMGRSFVAADFAPGSAPVIIISHRLWQTRFGGDPAIIGRHVESYSNDRPEDIGVLTIVGVLPEEFWHYQAFTDVLAPLPSSTRTYPYIIRLRDGVSPDVAGERIAALIRATHTMPEAWRVDVRSMHDSYVTSVRPLLLTLAAAAGLVLLIAAANVAVLLLIRSTERQREFAIRTALGASAGRISRALAAEAMVLGTAAVVFGLGLAQAVITSLAPVIERQLGRAAPGGEAAFSIDGFVLAGAAAGGLFVVLVCSLAPIWAARTSATSGAMATGHRAVGSRAQQHMRMALVSVEIAACLTLLVGAVLMVQSGLRILGSEIGLDTSGVSVGRLSLNVAAYPDPASRTALFNRVEAAATEIPGLTGLAFTNSWPLQAAAPREISRENGPTARPVRAGLTGVSAAYFSTVGIQVLDGRTFSDRDRIGSARVAVASQTVADRLWPGERAVGQRIQLAASPNAPAGTPPELVEVIGVVSDIRHSHLDEDAADVYVALSQQGTTGAFLYMRTRDGALGVLDAFRHALRRIDDGIVTSTMRPLGDILDQQRAGSRFLAQLLVVFAALSVVLALLGIHGVIAYAAGQRRREIAVRMAIGASQRAIATLFLRQGAVMVALGIAAGIGGAIALGQVLQAQLFGVTAGDPLVIALSAVSLALLGLLATTGPARRAGSTDPAEALKGD